MNMKIPLAVGLPDLLRINFFQPIFRGNRRNNMVVQSLQGVIHIAVFINAPVFSS
jgi:hypothetical protein